MEGSGDDEINGLTVLLEVVGFMLAGGFLAFLLLVAEMKLLQLTSSLTMGIFGTAKEVLQVVLALLILHEHLSVTNAAGLALCIGGTLGYHWVRAGPFGAVGGGGHGGAGGSRSAGVDGLGEYDRVHLADVELAGFLTNDSDSDDDGDVDAFLDGTGGTLLDKVRGGARTKRRVDSGKATTDPDDGELSDGWDDHT